MPTTSHCQCGAYLLGWGRAVDIFNSLTLEMLMLWALSAVGVWHILTIAERAVRRHRYAANDLRDSANQLRFVQAADFKPKKVMTLAEYKVFKTVEEQVASMKGGYRVFAQTSLGEIMSCDDRRGFSSINSKRADVVVIGPNGEAKLVVEYQGAGHYQGDAAARDAVKKEALRKAGVAYLEVNGRDGHDDIKLRVFNALSSTNRASVRSMRKPNLSAVN